MKKLKNITIDALFLALLIVSAQLSITVGLTKFTLQLLLVIVMAELLDLKNSLLVLTCYIVLGLIGVPVFASWGGGIAYVFSPTFGFVYGFYALILIKCLFNFWKEKKHQPILNWLGSILGVAMLYAIGYLHGFLILKGAYNLSELLTLFIVPYIPFDIIKIVLGEVIVWRLNKYFMKEYHFKTIDSTSSYLKRNYRKLGNMTFVQADYQEQGHGRFARTWTSEKGTNLMFSVLIKDEVLIEKYASISLASAVSVLHVLQNLGLKSVSVKWPNDVYVNDKKICGILLESVAIDSKLQCLIVGIGLNINATFEGELANKATSCFLETKKKIAINKVKKQVYRALKTCFEKIKKDQSNYLEVANTHNYLYDKEVYAEYQGQKVLVKAQNINVDNSLKILIDNHEVNVRSGEITFHF